MPEETLQSTLGLDYNETEILLRLVAWGRLAREQVPAIAVRAHQQIKISSVNAIIGLLRKKLAAHDIALITIHGFGWELGRGGPRKNYRAYRSQTGPGSQYGGR